MVSDYVDRAASVSPPSLATQPRWSSPARLASAWCA